MGKLLHEELSYKIRGTLFRAYNTLGPGFREETYKQATKHDLLKIELPIEVEKEIPIPYEDDPAIDIYRLDILVDKKILYKRSFTRICVTLCMAASAKSTISSARDAANRLMKKRSSKNWPRSN